MRPLKILLLDDDPIFVFLTKKTIQLTIKNAEIIVFGDGEEAFQFFLDNKNNEEALPDILYVDINMPVMDGWEFSEKMAEFKNIINKDFTLYLLSSTISPHDMEKARGIRSVSEALVKPLSKEKLVEIYNKHQKQALISV